jgi:hypothetical protein
MLRDAVLLAPTHIAFACGVYPALAEGAASLSAEAAAQAGIPAAVRSKDEVRFFDLKHSKDERKEEVKRDACARLGKCEGSRLL